MRQITQENTYNPVSRLTKYYRNYQLTVVRIGYVDENIFGHQTKNKTKKTHKQKHRSKLLVYT